MTTIDWIMVGGFIVAGLLLGNMAGRITGGLLAKDGRPEPIRDAAGAIGGLVTSVFVVAGLMAALGILQPEALAQIPRDLVAFLPRALSAAIIVIGANVLTSFVQVALRPVLARSSANTQRQVNGIVKAFILGLAAVLAVAQLGVDTTVINLAVAAIFFGVAASLVLLVGLGGQSVAREVAANRAVRRLVNEGDYVEIGAHSGVVNGLRPTAVELAGPDGSVGLVPCTDFLNGTLLVRRSDRSDSAER